MPNHVINEIRIEGIPSTMVDDILAKTVDKDGQIDFSILLPLPIHFWPGSVSSKHKETFPGTHLDAAIDIWGTKWGAYGQNESEYDPIEKTAKGLIFRFQTAWSPPYGWLMAIFNTFEVSFEHTWLSEGATSARYATFSYPDLKHIYREPWTEVLSDQKTHRRMHKLLWGVEEFEDETV